MSGFLMFLKKCENEEQKKEKCGRPGTELCEEDGRVEGVEEEGREEAGEGCKCDPVTSGWWEI